MNKNINCLIQEASATMNNKNCVSNKLAKGKLPDRKKCEVDILSPNIVPFIRTNGWGWG